MTLNCWRAADDIRPPKPSMGYAVLRKPARQLPVVLSCPTLQPNIMIGWAPHWPFAASIDGCQRLDQLVANDFDHVLRGRQRGKHLFPMLLFMFSITA